MESVEMRENVKELFLQQLENVFKNSPFYQKKFKEAGVKLDEIQDLDDIKKTSIYNKRRIKRCLSLRAYGCG